MYILHNTEALCTTTVAVEKWKTIKYYIFWMCVCSFRYPACNTCTPYCHLWPVQLHSIFSHYLINVQFVKKSYWPYNVCF